MIEVLTNTDNRSIRKFIIDKLKSSRLLDCAVAYFSDSAIVETCLNSNIKVKLLVSLTPPINPYILKKLLPHPTSKIEIRNSVLFDAIELKCEPFVLIVFDSW